MACQHVTLPGGGSAIVCGGVRQRCACGRPATLLCDWKVEGKKSGTCDRPICKWCSFKPAADKDLCQAHFREFNAWKAARESKSGSAPDCAPLPAIDAPAAVTAGVSAPNGRSSSEALAAEQPETSRS